ncbi:MAG: hypothetical protein U0805_13690 [Pirellulales bacterium]
MENLEQIPELPLVVRFRFGLKTLLVVMTVMCLYLGYEAVRERRAEQLRARDMALVAAVRSSLSKVPHGTSLRSPAAQTWPGSLWRHKFHLRVAASQSISLSVDSSFDHISDYDVSKSLLEFFGRDMEAIGLAETNLSDAEDPILLRSAWQCAEEGTLVLIEVRMGSLPTSRTAIVSMVLIHNEDVWP